MSLKRNEFLDAGDSEDDIGHDNDVEEDTRFKALPSKRRKLNPSDDEDAASDLSDQEQNDDDEGATLTDEPRGEIVADHPQPTTGSSKPKLKPLTPAQLAASQKKARKTGVIYISRVPPFMKPSALRNLLSPYGTILRIFLTPEPTPMYTRRVKSGGNKKRSFVDGWVEFESKKKAKIVAETLNGNIIGGKKGSWYHDDIWNLKYLRGFKWSDLMEQVQNEEREREGRMRVALEKEAKDRKAFLRNAELAKKQSGMEAKRKKKMKGEEGEGQKEQGRLEEGEDDTQDKKRRGEMRFTQVGVKDESTRQKREDQSQEFRTALGSLF